MQPRIFESELDRFLQVWRRSGIVFLLKKKHPQFALSCRKIGLDGNCLFIRGLGRCRIVRRIQQSHLIPGPVVLGIALQGFVEPALRFVHATQLCQGPRQTGHGVVEVRI